MLTSCIRSAKHSRSDQPHRALQQHAQATLLSAGAENAFLLQKNSTITSALSGLSSTTTTNHYLFRSTRYLYAVFEGTNTSVEVLNNVDLFAAYVDTDNTRNLAGTAVADLRDALGVRLDDPGFARSIRPTHRMQDESGTLSVKQDEADFQGVDQRFDTVMHMQYTAAGNRTKVPGAWAVNLPNGVYQVTVGVSDAPSSTNGYDSLNAVNLVGGGVIEGFQATGAQEYLTATALVGVTDGRLILDVRGSNTKLDYVDIVSQPLAPFVTKINPQNRAANHGVEDGVAAGVFVPGNGVGVAPATLQGNVKLVKVSTGALVAGSTGSTGSNDAITFAPAQPLEPSNKRPGPQKVGVRDVCETHPRDSKLKTVYSNISATGKRQPGTVSPPSATSASVRTVISVRLR